MDFGILTAIVFGGLICLLLALIVSHLASRALDVYLVNAREQRCQDNRHHNDDAQLVREQLNFDYAEKNANIATYADGSNVTGISDDQKNILTHGIRR